MAKFELVSKHKADGQLPVRKTAASAGYDFFVAEDTLIPPYEVLSNDIANYRVNSMPFDNFEILDEPVTLDEMAAITKAVDAKPTLVPTGVKANLESNTYLELSVRSSCPYKYWLLLANGEGIIDSDYYNNPDNEGHIYFQFINLSPLPIILKKGDCIGQGIIKSYNITEDDKASGDRKGGFGSTDKE